MEKNGNTFSVGDMVRSIRSPTAKTSSRCTGAGEVRGVDNETEQVIVKWANGIEEPVPLHQLERLP